jgi:phage baseplate assembly protein W
MAFGAVQQFPNDLRPSVGIGVNLPFSEGNGFTPNYTTAESIRYNLINYFLTNPGERPGNPQFGGGLRRFIFSQIDQNNLEFLKEDVQTKITNEFPSVLVKKLNVLGNPDENEVTVQIFYAIEDTNIEDEVILNFA